ncbi:MAG: 4'-phosphopantetheinyl transferase superfamily protein [Victivallales bacterium]|nr:4'-phosphopantetheinyl transferase superfamily protein [Victivallales bacterium]
MKLLFTKIEDKDYISALNILYRKLNAFEQQLVNQYKFDKCRAIEAISILLKKFVIEKIFNLKKYRIIKNNYGKPYIENYYDNYFNVSHSENHVVSAVSEVEIGVDIEFVKPFRDFIDIAKRFFSINEYTYLTSIKNEKEQIEVFYKIWTKKESFIKAIGQGVSLGLDKFDVPLNISDGNILNYMGSKWYFTEVKSFDRLFPAAICEKGKFTGNLNLEYIDITHL